MNESTNNLIKLPVKDLAKKNVCDGHLYLSVGTKKFYLMKPGVLVDPGFIKKHALHNPTFDFESVVNETVKDEFKSLFKELKYLQFEKDLRGKCSEILQKFIQIYSKEEHFLSFALACYEEFCLVSFEDQKKMHETDMHLFRKALYSSAFSIIVGMSNDYYQFIILKDFYNLTFSLDIGLCEDNYSYYVAEACNHESREPGSGIKYLENERASEFEKNVFIHHPEKSYNFLKSNQILSYPELVEAALYQHELADGSGFPRGVVKGQFSSWEAIVIFSDSLVEITHLYEFEKNVVDYLLNFKSKRLHDLILNRVHRKLSLVLMHFSETKDIGA